MANIQYIGIRHIWYGDVFSEAVTPAKLKAWLGTATAITNCHDGTFSFSQDDPEVTEYKNELTGEIYHKDKTSNGNSSIAFEMGQYGYEDMVAFMGGEVIKDGQDVIGWSAPSELKVINKAIVAQTKEGNYIVFTNADIVGKTGTQEKALTLAVTATALTNPNEGVKSQYRYKGTAVDKVSD